MIRSTLTLVILFWATAATVNAQEMTLSKRNIWPSASPISNLDQLLVRSTPSAWNGEMNAALVKHTPVFPTTEFGEGQVISHSSPAETPANDRVVFDPPMTANITLDDEAHLKKYMSDNDVKRMIQQRAQRERELRQMRLESQRFYGVSASRPSGARLMYGGMVAPTGYGVTVFGQGPRRPAPQF
jgi:hypothetical protein